MILKWYIKTTNGYVRFKSLSVESVIKVDDYVIKDDIYPAIAVTDQNHTTEVIQFNRYADRNIVFAKVQQALKDNKLEMHINYLDMYPSIVPDADAAYELLRHSASIREVSGIIKDLKVPNYRLLDAVRILRPDVSENLINGKVFSAKNLILDERYKHVVDPLHMISAVWTLCLPIPKKFHKIHINANQYFDFICNGTV